MTLVEIENTNTDLTFDNHMCKMMTLYFLCRRNLFSRVEVKVSLFQLEKFKLVKRTEFSFFLGFSLQFDLFYNAIRM